MQSLIEVINDSACNLPMLIQPAVNLLMSPFSGIVSTLGSINTNALLKGAVGIGLPSGITVALGAPAGLIPSAMVGVLNPDVVMVELAVVLVVIGGLAQIPGFNWLIGEGGKLLRAIGDVVGGSIGGIAGEFVSGIFGSFPQTGANLAVFTTNVRPFIDGTHGIDAVTLGDVGTFTETISLITAANLLEGLTPWLTGGSSPSTFVGELTPFGEAMVKFPNNTAGPDGNLVSMTTAAGKIPAEMAATLPDRGGIAGFFAGEDDIGEFGNQLVDFGGSMMWSAASTKGPDAGAVNSTAITRGAIAGMVATLSNTGGAVAFFVGNDDMSVFGDQLVPSGKAIKAYFDTVTGLDVDAVKNSVITGWAMAELVVILPDTGDVVTFFAGNNGIATSGAQSTFSGAPMKNYSRPVSGLDGNTVENSAIIGGILVELVDTILNTGGLVAPSTGGSDLETFGN